MYLYKLMLLNTKFKIEIITRIQQKEFFLYQHAHLCTIEKYLIGLRSGGGAIFTN